MLYFIDISSWQGDIDLSPLPIDAVVVKATEGTDYVNPWCDPKIQEALSLGKKFGFYHYANYENPVAEADWFVDNCKGYFNHGIPVLDWEEGQGVDWVNSFVNRVYERTGVWPWIYSTPYYFNQGGVEANCGRWVATWPNLRHPGFDFDSSDVPDTDGLVCAWQYCSDGRIDGYDDNLDLSHFFGDENAWDAYANPGGYGTSDDSSSQDDGLETGCDKGCCPCCRCKG